MGLPASSRCMPRGHRWRGRCEPGQLVALAGHRGILMVFHRREDVWKGCFCAVCKGCDDERCGVVSGERCCTG